MYVVSSLVYIHYYASCYPLLGHNVQGPFVLAHLRPSSDILLI
jgi:hypothetical protein